MIAIAWKYDYMTGDGGKPNKRVWFVLVVEVMRNICEGAILI